MTSRRPRRHRSSRLPTTVTVTPSSANLSALGETVQLTAAVQDQNGNPLPGAVVSWSSSSAMVATVDAAGLELARNQLLTGPIHDL